MEGKMEEGMVEGGREGIKEGDEWEGASGEKGNFIYCTDLFIHHPVILIKRHGVYSVNHVWHGIYRVFARVVFARKYSIIMYKCKLVFIIHAS